MTRHLLPEQAAAALRRGKQVEQLLRRDRLPDGRMGVRWLAISPDGPEFRLSLHHVVDIGDEIGTGDISEFPPIDADEYVGEGRSVAASDSVEDILEFAATQGALADRWVNQGIVGDEYLDSRVKGAG